METPSSVFPTQLLLLERAEGLLAGLIYLDSTATTIFHFPYHSSNFQISNQWEVLRTVQVQLDERRHRLLAATHNLCLAGLDDALNCFVEPTRFYEAAISGYRNTFLHKPPNTLGEALAFSSLSHAILHSAGNQISFDFSHLDIWRNAIANHEHRQLFEDLFKAACLEPYLTGQNFCSLPTLMNDNRSMQQSYLGEPSTIPPLQGDGLVNDSLSSFWNHSNTMDVFLAFNSPFASQTGHCNYMINGSTHLPGIQAPNLQGSPIIRSVTHFLEDCGELTFVLSSPSSRGATVQSTQSKMGNRVEPLYIQRLRNDDSFKDPRIQGIVSVLDSFISLGYLQSVNEAQHYMLLLGNVCTQVPCYFNRRFDSR